MANLKEIKNRITSISSTMQITSAMKMVSAAKLKRAQDAITQMRPYAKKLQEILGNVSGSLDLSENAYAEERELKNVLIIGVSSNRGLCGGFNNNITKQINHLLKNDLAGLNVRVLSIGKKINDSFKNSAYNLRPDGLGGAEEMFNDLSFERAAEHAQYAMDEFLKGTYDKVIVVYNQFKNAAVQEVQAEQLLPIVTELKENETQSSVDYIFEPSKMEILTDLIPKTLK